MNVKSMTEFKHELEATLDSVSANDDTVIINRPDDKDIVLISIKTYNSIQETLYLLSSEKNRERLDHAIRDINDGINLVKGDVVL